MASFQSTLIRFLIRRSNTWNKPLNEVKKDFERMGQKMKMPEGVKIISISEGGIKGDWMTPDNAKKDRLIVYIHGGGGCLGIFNSNRRFVAGLAKDTGIETFMLDYRLAPERPYPAALEDTIGAYGWLLAKGYMPQDIVFAGDSSGCGLCIAALNVLKDSGYAMPAAMALITPMLDYEGKGDSMTSRVKKDPFHYINPLGNAKLYIGDNDPSSPRISPLYGDLSGLSPMLIHAADYDVFLSDAISLAEKAEEAGISVDFKIWDKMWHIFHMQAEVVPEGKAALKEVCHFIEEHIG